MEKAPLEAGLEYCIDSWWVMYLEGQVIYIYYLGSECFCVGCNQNGGGGGSGGGSPNPEQLLANFEGQGTAISGPEHSQILSSSANAENVVYTWQIYQAFTYGLVSYEDAEINKVLSPSGSVIKSFHNMTHRKIASVGISVGGTRTFEDLGASFNISQFRVDERIDFTVTHSAAGLTGLAIPYNANKTFKLTIPSVTGF